MTLILKKLYKVDMPLNKLNQSKLFLRIREDFSQRKLLQIRIKFDLTIRCSLVS